MEQQQIPMSTEITELPDKDGKPVAVGDYIMRDGEIWKVTGIRKVEGYVDDPRSSVDPRPSFKASGFVDITASQFELERRGDHIVEFAAEMNLEGVTTSGCRAEFAEKYELTPGQRKLLKLGEYDIALSNIDRIIALLRGRAREIETEKRLAMTCET